ncbi:pantothenate transporter FEN2 [Scheffersomyces amazonensis]|uniref:pantothenate transporter FEN2 n=1 Tax=Scheffersomyces amazonensis TaxID=1078765 RepID=UPI00315D786D
MKFLTKLKISIWGKTPEDPKEARLLFKLDWFILSYCCLVYWINYLDRTNLSNAYVSGMMQDLNMKGDEFNIMNTCFTVGYVVALVPHNLILLKVRPRYWMTFCAFAWGVMTLSIYKVTAVYQVYIIRFFTAVFEAVTFTGVHLILGSFYEDHLLPFRTAIFTSSGLVGSIFSGFLQSAIYSSMDNYRGIAGWRWLFIIDFLITVPIVIYGFIFFPDPPQISRAFYFTEEEHQILLAKINKPKHDKLDWTVLKRVFANWHFYLFSFLFAIGGEDESFPINSLFALWLQYYDYSVPDRNHFPMGVFGTGVFFTLASAVYINVTGGNKHWHIGIYIMIIMIISSILLLAGHSNTVAVFIAHYLSGAAYAGQTAYFAWANVVCANDLQERSIVLASMNMFSNAVNAWWSIVFYGADTAPRFTKGMIAMIFTAATTGITSTAIMFLQKRDERLEALEVVLTSNSLGNGTIQIDFS